MTSAIRIARALDLPEVLSLERSTPELPHWPRSEYERYVAMPATALDRVIFVAEEAEVLVGFAAAALSSASSRMAELESIAGVPGMRRSGVGRELCRHVIEWSRGQHGDALELEVRSRSSEAIALYRSLGFRVLRTRSRYYTNPADDALLMSLVL